MNLRHLLRYDAKTGKLFWLVDRGNSVKAGDQAGYINYSRLGRPRVYVKINKKLLLAARIIWEIVHGKPPTGDIDHINGNTIDDRLDNLREATRAENCRNRKAISNASGFKGVRKYKKKWRWYIMVNGRTFAKGGWDTPEEAFQDRSRVLANYHGKFSNDGASK